MYIKPLVSKSVSLILALLLMLSFAGCGSSTQGGTSTTGGIASEESKQGTTKPEQKLYTVDVIPWAGTNDPGKFTSSDQQEIGKIIKDKFGIVLNYMPFSGDYNQKTSLMLAAGDYPEILRVPDDTGMYQKYVTAGAALPLDDYLKDAPNFIKTFEKQIPFWRASSPDNKLYKWELNVPQSSRVNVENFDMIVRTDALEKQGWPNLLSTDDYYNFIKKAVEDSPTTNGRKTIGLTMPLGEDWGMISVLTRLFEHGDTYVCTSVDVIWNEKEQKYGDYFTNPVVKEGLQFYNKLYRDGLFDKECFTDKWDQYAAKMNSGTAICGWFTNWGIAGFNAALQAANHPEMQYVMLPVQSNSQVAAGERRKLQVEEIRSTDSVIITKNAKYPERLFKLVDYFASDEGQILLQNGIEGEDYSVKDGKRVPLEPYIKYAKGLDPDYKAQKGILSFCLFSDLLFGVSSKDGLAYSLKDDPAYIDQIKATDRQKEAFQKLGWSGSLDWWMKNADPVYTGLNASVSIDPATDLGTKLQKMNDFRVRNLPKLIMAKSDSNFESIYTSLVEEYNKLDPQKIVDKYNELYQEKAKNLQK